MPTPQRMLSKRTDPQPRGYGPVWNKDNCVLCPEEDLLKLDAKKLLEKLTVPKMKSYMRGKPEDLKNKCVFYTKNEDRKAALASPATDWACLYSKYTAWVSWSSFWAFLTYMLCSKG